MPIVGGDNRFFFEKNNVKEEKERNSKRKEFDLYVKKKASNFPNWESSPDLDRFRIICYIYKKKYSIQRNKINQKKKKKIVIEVQQNI